VHHNDIEILANDRGGKTEPERQRQVEVLMESESSCLIAFMDKGRDHRAIPSLHDHVRQTQLYVNHS